jgi:hypothetical protein
MINGSFDRRFDAAAGGPSAVNPIAIGSDFPDENGLKPRSKTCASERW